MRKSVLSKLMQCLTRRPYFDCYVPEDVNAALSLIKHHSGNDGLTSEATVLAALAHLHSRLEKNGDIEGLKRFQNEIVPHINLKEAFHFCFQDSAKSQPSILPLVSSSTCAHLPEYLSKLDGGHLHLQITSRCNMRCSFCYQKDWDQQRLASADMPSEWIYEYFRPLYERVQEINVFGGEVTAIPEGFRCLSFLAEKYPHVTLHLESNGLAFNEKYQDLAVDNLMYVSFSVNAATPQTYARAIWPQGGEKAWNTVHENIDNYIRKLRAANLAVFAPVITMVVSPETAHEIYDFVVMGLKWGCRRIHLLLNQRFSRCEDLEPVMKWALREMLKMERVLSGKVPLEVKLFLPEKIGADMQKEVDSLPIEVLMKEYSELLKLANDRDEESEHLERMRIRMEHGKKHVEKSLEIMSSCGAYFTGITTEDGMCKVCAPPWKSLYISFDGMVTQCQWNYHYKIKLNTFMKEDGIAWEALLNCPEFQLMRQNILHGNYVGCMAGCPCLPHVAKALRREM